MKPLFFEMPYVVMSCRTLFNDIQLWMSREIAEIIGHCMAAQNGGTGDAGRREKSVSL